MSYEIVILKQSVEYNWIIKKEVIEKLCRIFQCFQIWMRKKYTFFLSWNVFVHSLHGIYKYTLSTSALHECLLWFQITDISLISLNMRKLFNAKTYQNFVKTQ